MKNRCIWVDADACPNVIKDILFRAAIRMKTALILVSNHTLTVPSSPFISRMQVPQGFDVADNKIMQQVKVGDLVITADIPLADAVVARGATALNPRGELYTEKNIKERLSLRNFNMNLRDNGLITGGPATIGKKEIQDFANRLDAFLMKNNNA